MIAFVLIVWLEVQLVAGILVGRFIRSNEGMADG